jgi:two-component system, OmpR family, sensor kinase
VGLAGTILIRRTMKPLEQLSEVATRVSQLPLDAGEVALAVRVPPSNSNPGTEVGSVGHALNLMLDNVASALQARQKSETKVRQFVADASHELRTPLTAIRGYTELMRMTEDFTPDGQKSLARVQSQSERMTALVEDLLLLARLDEGQPLKLTEVDLTQLVVESVSDEKVMAPGHTWRLELPDEPVVVNGDASQLRQVLVNLLSNARKHTPSGTTVVTGVGTSPEGAAIVTVRDDGGGIPAAFVDHVFSRFARADAARKGSGDQAGASAAEGTSGLGLSIVQSIVEAHGGRVTVTSRPGHTEFALQLPLLQQQGQDDAPSS